MSQIGGGGGREINVLCFPPPPTPTAPTQNPLPNARLPPPPPTPPEPNSAGTGRGPGGIRRGHLWPACSPINYSDDDRHSSGPRCPLRRGLAIRTRARQGEVCATGGACAHRPDTRRSAARTNAGRGGDEERPPRAGARGTLPPTALSPPRKSSPSPAVRPGKTPAEGVLRRALCAPRSRPPSSEPEWYGLMGRGFRANRCWLQTELQLTLLVSLGGP